MPEAPGPDPDWTGIGSYWGAKDWGAKDWATKA